MGQYGPEKPFAWVHTELVVALRSLAAQPAVQRMYARVAYTAAVGLCRAQWAGPEGPRPDLDPLLLVGEAATWAAGGGPELPQAATWQAPWVAAEIVEPSLYQAWSWLSMHGPGTVPDAAGIPSIPRCQTVARITYQGCPANKAFEGQLH
jgi:hypothetical protein